MHGPSGSTEPSAGVVLLVPEVLGKTPDPERLHATLKGSPRAARVLLYLTGNAGAEFVTILGELKLDFQILLADDAADLETQALCVRAPPDMLRKDQIEFALALSDCLLVASKSDQHPIAANASKQLGMSLVVPGDRLPALKADSFTHRLDPESPGRRIFHRLNGRLEQFMLELLAFDSSDRDDIGQLKSGKRLRKCVTSGWGPGAYFAPSKWRDLAPDRDAIEPSAPIVAAFEAMDRSALHGSYIHRDIAWFTHIGAAFAVFAAVAGFVFRGSAILWGVLEIVTLALIAGWVFWTRRTSLQERWTACRLAAEQLRIARMSLPLLVLPPALATQDEPAAGHGKGDDKLDFVALARVKRAVRDQGLPRLGDDWSPEHAARWLDLIVFDQLTYHRNNNRKLESAEKRLRHVTQVIFGGAVIAVLAHLVINALERFAHVHFQDEWLLLFTAAGPALAAAFHGAGTRLGIVHRAALSEEVEAGLTTIDTSIKSFLKAPSNTREAWSQVRDLADAAANRMGNENTSWHVLVRRYRDDLPA
jgi:hypothetical protein